MLRGRPRATLTKSCPSRMKTISRSSFAEHISALWDRLRTRRRNSRGPEYLSKVKGRTAPRLDACLQPVGRNSCIGDASRYRKTTNSTAPRTASCCTTSGERRVSRERVMTTPCICPLECLRKPCKTRSRDSAQGRARGGREGNPGSLRSQGKLRQLFWGQDERYIIRSRKHNEPETTNRLPEESHAQRLVGGDYFLAEYGILPHVHQRGDNFSRTSGIAGRTLSPPERVVKKWLAWSWRISETVVGTSSAASA